MCGICGVAGKEDKLLVRKMVASIRHRGPDQQGYFSDNKITLGHARLSIIDLSEKGRQPMSNEDSSIWVVFNGEIYNHLEIRKKLGKHSYKSRTDTEVLLHAYEDFGESFVNLLNGDFAFAIYDSKNKSVFLARDRLGIKPLYYYHDEKRKQLFFASELKALLENEELERKIDLAALNQFVSMRYIHGEHTVFSGIKRLLPGHSLSFDISTGRLAVKKYWDADSSNKNILDKPEDYFVKKLRAILEKTVERRLMSDVPLGVYLSGGIDSSAVVAMMSRISKAEPIKTFSVGFGYGEEVDELKHAKLVADKFSTDHHEFTLKSDIIKTLPRIIWHCDEPMADPALIPVFLLSEQAKKKATVVLTGDGSDELFAGYEQCKFLLLADKFKYVPKAVREAVIPPALQLAPKPLLNKVFKYSSSLGKQGLNRASKTFVDAGNKGKAYVDIVSLYDEAERKELMRHSSFVPLNLPAYYNQSYFKNKNSHLNQILYAELKTVLPENYLMKADKMTLAHAVEERVPFLDHELVEFSFTIPARLKLKGFNEKYILKKAMQGIVPSHILKRKKQRFYVPIDLWIRDDLKPMAQELLSEKTIRQQGYFDYKCIGKMFRNYDSSRLFYSRQLWNLLTFQLWHKMFIEGEKPSSIL